MSGIQDHVPFSVERIKNLAQALGVGRDLMWINPVTGAIDLRDLAHTKLTASAEVENDDLVYNYDNS